MKIIPRKQYEILYNAAKSGSSPGIASEDFTRIAKELQRTCERTSQ
jgi:hypothetical protein